MNCHYCRFVNPSDEHRCRRCGRRLHIQPARPAPVGVNALPVDGALARETAVAAEALRPRTSPTAKSTAKPPVEKAKPAHSGTVSKSSISSTYESLWQEPLFPERENAAPPAEPRKVVSIRPGASGAAAASPAPAKKAPARRPAQDPALAQPQLDFAPAPPTGKRSLKSTVEASIYCDAPVASPEHRALAAAIDLALVALALGLCTVAYILCGGEFFLTRYTTPLFAGAAGLTVVFYGALWSIAGVESPGMQWTRLQVVNFDGFPPEPRQKGLRFLGTCVSVAAGGLGLLWALVDEESLTWHDHMSQTFPTLRDELSASFRKR